MPTRTRIANTNGAQGSVLTNIALIDGLQELLGAGVTSFGSGNIILGGDGSDIIEGRGGDDLIDGDQWLNVRVSVRAGIDPVTGLPTGAEIATFDSIADMIPFMLDGTYNPGQLQIVREILPGAGGFDTANFSGPLANYTIIVDDNGTPLDATDNIITVIDNTAPGGGSVSDGIDRLTHIERLQFADQSISFAPELNNDPVGQLIILDADGNPDNTPAEGQLLRASIAGVTDADNPGDGSITGPVAYHWQVETRPGTGIFEDIRAGGSRQRAGARRRRHLPGDPGSCRAVDPRQGRLSGRQRRAGAGLFSRNRGSRGCGPAAARAGPGSAGRQ